MILGFDDLRSWRFAFMTVFVYDRLRFGRFAFLAVYPPKVFITIPEFMKGSLATYIFVLERYIILV
jgi:hypothetical protein